MCSYHVCIRAMVPRLFCVCMCSLKTNRCLAVLLYEYEIEMMRGLALLCALCSIPRAVHGQGGGRVRALFPLVPCEPM